jgi:hypothetical protein
MQGSAFRLYMMQAGKDLGRSFSDELRTQLKAGPKGGGGWGALGTAVTGGAITGGAATIAGHALGAPVGQAVAAAGTAVTGAVSAGAALATGNVAGAAAIGLTALAGAATTAVGAMKGFAGAAMPGGLKIFDQTLHMLAASVGVTLMPFMVKLGAAVATAAEFLDAKFTGEALVGAANQTIDWANEVGKAAEGIAGFTVAVVDFATKVKNWVTGFFAEKNPKSEYAKDPSKDPHLGKNERAGDIDWWGALGGRKAFNPEDQPKAGDKSEEKPGWKWKPISHINPADPNGFPWAAKGKENMTAFVKDMRAELGSQGQRVTTTGITDAWKKAQESVGGGNFEKKLLGMMDNHLKMMEQQLGIARKEEQKPPLVTR